MERVKKLLNIVQPLTLRHDKHLAVVNITYNSFIFPSLSVPIHKNNTFLCVHCILQGKRTIIYEMLTSSSILHNNYIKNYE